MKVFKKIICYVYGHRFSYKYYRDAYCLENVFIHTGLCAKCITCGEVVEVGELNIPIKMPRGYYDGGHKVVNGKQTFLYELNRNQ